MSQHRIVHVLSTFINRNTGWLIAFAIVFFGLITIGRQSTTNHILSDTRATTKNTQAIAQDTKQIITDLKQAVVDMKADNERQTLILCRLILGGDVELSGEDALEVERICKERVIQQLSVGNAVPILPENSDTSGGETDPLPNGNAPTPQPQEPEEPQPELPNQNVLERALGSITSVLEAIL